MTQLITWNLIFRIYKGSLEYFEIRLKIKVIYILLTKIYKANII